jgi:hypothetical protein
MDGSDVRCVTITSTFRTLRVTARYDDTYSCHAVFVSMLSSCMLTFLPLTLYGDHRIERTDFRGSSEELLQQD